MRPRRVRARPHTLRGQLTLVNVLLLAAGLTLAAGASVFGLYTFLVGKVDSELTDARDAFAGSGLGERAIDTACQRIDEVGATPAGTVLAGAGSPFAEVVAVAADGERPRRVCTRVTALAAEERSALIDEVTDPWGLADTGPVTVRADGVGHYRITAARLRDDSVVLLATSLNDVRTSVRRLLLIDLGVGITLLVSLAALSLAAARRRLRPLEDMAHAAGAVAEATGDLAQGDLAGRLPPAGSGGSAEVEQLRTALNAMLRRVERVNGHLRQFVADASHELRTPLAAIRGYLQLHERGMLVEQEERRAFRRIAEESRRMGHLVDDLLVLARLDRRPAPRPRPVDLVRLVGDGAADLRAQQPGRPVSVETDDEVVVRGDEGMLRQLVGNLLSNVRVHTPPDSRVTVCARRDPEGGPGGGAVLRVSDTGPGMAGEDADRVFDRFFRADPDRARATGGSGLGMSIVRAVVEAHDGGVELITAPGQGMTVTVRLPRARADENSQRDL